MKRIMLLGLAALCMAGFAFCQNVRTFPPMNPGMMPPTGPGMTQPMGPGTMQQMANVTQISMVATSDDGIIVLFNNRLIKYDKDLNRLKEENLNAGKYGLQQSSQKTMNPGMMPPTGPGMMQPVGNTTQASMVATSDGGIIVLFNNRLIKYDKDLNRLKEENLNAEKGRDTSGVETGIQPPVIHIQKPPQDLGH